MLSQYLVWPFFCMHYLVSMTWQGGNPPVSLLRCNGSPSRKKYMSKPFSKKKSVRKDIKKKRTMQCIKKVIAHRGSPSELVSKISPSPSGSLCKITEIQWDPSYKHLRKNKLVGHVFVSGLSYIDTQTKISLLKLCPYWAITSATIQAVKPYTDRNKEYDKY